MKYYGKIQHSKDLVTKEYADQKYVKPAGGIPDTDLSSAVQASLDKADSALQSVPGTYRTAAAQDAIDASQNTAINTKSTVEVWRLG